MTGFARKAIRRLPSGIKTRLRTAVHPAQGYALKRVFGPKAPDLGVLSVVIPAFNVEAYLAQCLDSVISQSYTNLEVVVVDDGSTDSTLKIANEYARSDKRIRVIGLEHGGNGRARNIGIAAARGSHLTFADSDDVVAADAYLVMMQTIHRTGSDFVVGSSDRLIGSQRIATKLSTRLHEVPRLAVSLADFPDILDDVFLWNKLFQRKFWDQHVGLIPEGVFYEDQETTARAFVRARSFDVLKENVYSWRQRPDGKSITQAKGELRNLHDRLQVAQSVSQLLLTDANSNAVQVWCRRLFGSDLTPYFDLVANRGDDYWEALQSGVSALLHTFAASESILDSTWHSMDPHARVFLKLVEANSRGVVEDIIVDRIDSGTGFEVVQKHGRFVAQPNYWEELEQTQGIPALSCTAGSLTFESEIRIRDLQDGRGPVLRGHAYIRGFASSEETDTIHVRIGLANGSERRVPVTRIEDSRIDVSANDAFASHAYSGFELDLEAHPEFITAISARVELSVGDDSWNAVHSLNVAESMDASQRVAVGSNPLVVGFTVDDGAETFSIVVDWGRTPASEQVFLSTSQVQIDPSVTVQVGAGVHRYSFDLHHLHWGRQVYSYPSGAYTLRHTATQNSKAVPFRASARLSMQTPLDHTLEHSNLTAWVTETRNFAVSIGAPLTMGERSKYGQRQLQQSFSKLNLVTVMDHLAIESFSGTQCTDSPLEIALSIRDKYPAAPVFVSISDYAVPFPENFTPVVRNTEHWCNIIQSAAVIINNDAFPHYFEKNPRQIFVQTWHGKPIKTIGNDAPIKYISPSYRRNLQLGSSTWDYLLAADSSTAAAFKSAFPAAESIIKIENPRNNSLQVKKSRRLEVRRTLGIAEDTLAVLYAPTWRENAKRGRTFVVHEELIDVSRLAQDLGEEFIVLYRAHHNLDSFQAMATEFTTMDVSGYPEVADLIIASDLLISDYSSIIFDYQHTGQPILIYAPDLVEYRDRIRGLYIDIEDVPSAGVHTSQKELTKEIIRLLNGNK